MSLPGAATEGLPSRPPCGWRGYGRSHWGCPRWLQRLGQGRALGNCGFASHWAGSAHPGVEPDDRAATVIGADGRDGDIESIVRPEADRNQEEKSGGDPLHRIRPGLAHDPAGEGLQERRFGQVAGRHLGGVEGAVRTHRQPCDGSQSGPVVLVTAVLRHVDHRGWSIRKGDGGQRSDKDAAIRVKRDPGQDRMAFRKVGDTGDGSIGSDREDLAAVRVGQPDCAVGVVDDHGEPARVGVVVWRDGCDRVGAGVGREVRDHRERPHH